jgi:hypothetical protein
LTILSKPTLINYLKELAEIRPLFYSEADFQHSFAILLSTKGHTVILEKSFYNVAVDGCLQEFYKEMHIDILIDGNTAVELKYKTKGLGKVYKDYEIKQHGATNHGRYDAYEDARRIVSLIIDDTYTEVQTGFTIFLTNEELYWSKPNSKSMNSEFSLVDGCPFKNSLSWKYKSKNHKLKKKTSGSTRYSKERNPMKVKFRDKILWQNFGKSNDEIIPNFKFFILDLSI